MATIEIRIRGMDAVPYWPHCSYSWDGEYCVVRMPLERLEAVE